jgi:tetratricopeptide (TPR) repeat protein
VNPSAVIDWQSALAVLVVGLAAGAILLWRTRRAPAAASPAAAIPAVEAIEQRDLAARRDALLQQLRELDDTASKRTPEQLARERYALELAAASVMRDLERQAPKEAASLGASTATAVPAVATPDRSALRGFLWGTATASAVGLVLFFASRAATPREEGGSLTGTTGALSTPERAAPMAGAAGDVQARLVQAREHLAQQDLMAVWSDTQFVLEREPGNPIALSYQALVRLAMGQADVAEAMLKQALDTAPDLLDAHLHLAVVYARSGRGALAEATLRAAMSRFPEHKAGLEGLMQELRQTASAGGVDPGAAGAHAGVAPPDDVHAPPPMETADGRPGAAPKMGAGSEAGMPARLSGVVEVDRSAQARVAGGGIVFVTVRAVGMTSGPPVAVKRLSAASLPGAFAITSADSMLGQELPERVRIEARLDPDGDPLTRAATDPAARLEDVKLGSTGLRLVLK